VDAPTQSILVLQGLVLAPALALVLARTARDRRVAGPVLAADHPYRRARRALLVAPQLAALLSVWASGAVPALQATALVAMGVLLALVAPGPHDAVCGERGVRRGWHARALAELEEWRLVGQHLRFRLHGEWTSVPVPAASEELVRERLLAACPERQSPFP
jgi:hypothetical protein